MLKSIVINLEDSVRMAAICLSPSVKRERHCIAMGALSRESAGALSTVLSTTTFSYAWKHANFR
jgi:hypothetical protein